MPKVTGEVKSLGFKFGQFDSSSLNCFHESSSRLQQAAFIVCFYVIEGTVSPFRAICDQEGK